MPGYSALCVAHLLDTFTRLADFRSLASYSEMHFGPVLAVKVKGLKALRGVGPEGRRLKVMRALGRCVRRVGQRGVAGRFGRFYVLLDAAWKGVVLAPALAKELDNTLDALGLADLREPPKPFLLTGIGRSWQEAHLITRGRIVQADVPIDLRLPDG
jgi:hypothetical protein